MRIGAFPPEAPFLPALARLWLAAPTPPEDGLIILPSRRSASALAGAFLEANGGKALLLPRIIALGNIDEAGLLVSAGVELPPALPEARRQAILAKLILAKDGPPHDLPGALALATELGALLDEADYAEVDLAEALPTLVPAELAEHWQHVLAFLDILTKVWPGILAGEGRMNPAARLVRLIRAQAEIWAQTPPQGRLWMVAGEGVPAVARMARVVAQSPRGLLVVPGFDPHLDDEAWDALETGHAQAGIAALLAEIGARREEIRRLPAPDTAVPEGRAALLSRALLPAAELTRWQEDFVPDLTGLSRLETGDEAQNARAIAMVLRDVLEVPGRTAALITPDRDLAARVASVLKRFGITADDSAGEALAQTPPAAMLRVLAQAAVSGYAPLPLLSLLKHPLTACGLPPGNCRDLARKLEVAALRGPRPAPGFAELRFRLAGKDAELVFLERLELMLAPLALPVAVNPAAALRALLVAAEALAATPDAPGAVALWQGEAGAALAERLVEALAVLEELPDMALADLPELLEVLLAGLSVRKPRAKDGHPRLAIWGLQEAALQSVDVAVLGGLVEGVWPAPAEPGPWLSRPMRKAARLASPEEKIGQAAAAFFALGCACPTVVLAAPRRRERAPAVPARWLTRLEAMLKGAVPRHEAALWAEALDVPVTREQRPKPAPRPPEAARPRTLSVTDVALLMTDPYALYARKILGIRELDALDEESDQQLFGEIVHAGLKDWFDAGKAGSPAVALEAAMKARRPRAALQTWWQARLDRIAEWLVAQEAERPAARVLHEVSGEMAVDGGFVLKGRADRLDVRPSGVAIYDYKTGTVPSAKEVKAGTAPQLPLEAVMVEAGAFPDISGPVEDFAYIKLSGRAEAGSERAVKETELREIIDTAAAGLPALFAKFADPATPYLAAPHPKRENRFDAYASLSRRAEWADEEDEHDGD